MLDLFWLAGPFCVLWLIMEDVFWELTCPDS